MLKNIVKSVREKHFYKVTPKYWGRIGIINKRYGEEVVFEAIETIQEREIPLEDFLNILESRCQYIVENGEFDELDDLIFGIGQND